MARQVSIHSAFLVEAVLQNSLAYRTASCLQLVAGVKDSGFLGDWQVRLGLLTNGKAVGASKLLEILLPTLTSSELLGLLESYRAWQVNDGQPGGPGAGLEDVKEGRRKGVVLSVQTVHIKPPQWGRGLCLPWTGTVVLYALKLRS